MSTSIVLANGVTTRITKKNRTLVPGVDASPRIVIRSAVTGPQGPAGSGGGGGGGSDAYYRHEQVTVSSTWTINHNLGKNPSVVVKDSAGTTWEGHVNYVSTSQIVISFTAAFSGEAYLN